MSKGNGVSLPFEETQAQYVVRRMAELGFHPNPGFAADRIEFYKDYSDTDGRFARAHIYFDKPIMGLENIRLANLVVSIQKSIAPELAAIEQEAPAVARDDLANVVRAFAELTAIPEQAVRMEKCVSCEQDSAEFFIVNGDAVCLRCVEARKAAT